MLTERIIIGETCEFQYVKDGVVTKRIGVLVPNSPTVSRDTHITIKTEGEPKPKSFRHRQINFFSYVL
jgi:hypothetical protein